MADYRRRYFITGATVPLCVLYWILLLSPLYAADVDSEDSVELNEQESVRLYRNPQERREAGLGREITDWLSFSGLVELEKANIKNRFSNGIDVDENENPILTLQIGLEFLFTDWLTAELLLETERTSSIGHTVVDEGYLQAEFGRWATSVGRHYLPFGRYFSNFVTDPMIQFGETNRGSLIVQYTIWKKLRVSGFAFDSDTSSSTNRDDKVDWGTAIEYLTDDESIRLGASYISDLTESDQQFLGEFDNIYENRVSGVSAYALVGMDKIELTAEFVITNGEIKEFDEDEDSPSAVNVELTYFPTRSTQIAVRMERSSQLADEPEQQYGIAGTWRPRYASITFEYLYGKFMPGFVEDDDENELRSRKIIAAKVSFEF